MTYPILVGQKFGQLTVLWIESQGADSPRRVYCRCDCGKNHNAIAPSIFKGATTRCRACANPNPPIGKTKYEMHQSFRRYVNGAGRRGYVWEITREHFGILYFGSCHYCGKSPAKGVDRRNNKEGYILGNCASCCKHCNLAKRDMTEQEFLGWVARIAAKQGFSL